MNIYLAQKLNKVEAEYKTAQKRMTALNNDLMRLNLHNQVQAQGVTRTNSAWFVADGKIQAR